MKHSAFLLAVTFVVGLSSCRSQPRPEPKPEGEVWVMWNTPDGQVHQEKAGEFASATADGPQEVTITTAVPRVERVDPQGPPEIERGRIVSVDWQGQGLREGEVLDVRGNWVKLRFVVTKEGPEPNLTIGAATVAWVNFDRLDYYIVPKVKRGARSEGPPKAPADLLQ